MFIKRRYLPVILLSGTMLLLSFLPFGLSCGSAPVSPAASVPEPVSPVPALPSNPPAQPSASPSSVNSWVADGIITAGEYAGEKTYGYYEIRWAGDDKYIYIAMKVQTGGWVAVGLQPGSRMKEADIMIGWINDGKAGMNDLFSTGDFGPHHPDVQQGGTYDIIEFGGRAADGYTVIEFKRALDTEDKYDKPFTKGVNKIIWAYGSAYSIGVKHVNRGYGEINLP